LNRPKGAIRPSGLRIPAKLAAAREHYDAAPEGHGYVYSQSPYSAHPGRRVVILELWYAAHFRTHTLGDRLFRRLVFVGIQPCYGKPPGMASADSIAC
jgi:hypothetical protein